MPRLDFLGVDMDLEARPLRCFVTVAELQSFSRAGQRLGLTQPAVSAQIRELERLIGFELFQRSTRRVELSERGIQFLDSARRMIDETNRLKRAVTALRQPLRDRIVIGAAFYTVDFPERIALFDSFIANHAEISIDIQERPQAELLRDLHRGEIDLVLTVGMPIVRRELHQLVLKQRGTEGLFADDLRRIVLRSEQVKLMVPQECLIAKEEIVHPSMLRGLTVAMLAPVFGDPITDPILKMLAAAGAVPLIPPEPTPTGVLRYARQFRIPAISLGWFEDHIPADARMTKRRFANLDLTTEFALVGNTGAARPAVELFWNAASEVACVN